MSVYNFVTRGAPMHYLAKEQWFFFFLTATVGYGTATQNTPHKLEYNYYAPGIIKRSKCHYDMDSPPIHGLLTVPTLRYLTET